MDIKNVNKVLKKINRLNELVNELGEANSTEKDLLKAYVIDLYDAVISNGVDDIIDLEKEEMRKKLKKQRKLEKKLKKHKERENVPAAAPVSVVQPEPEAKTEPQVKKITPQKPAAESIPIKKESAPAISSALTELFEINKGNEVSDKLSQRPISDLTKSMSINEKIFTMNELFGGSQTDLDNILIALNGLGSFEEAKDVLIRSVAQKYNWDAAEKSKKAKNFIKLVQRRYN